MNADTLQPYADWLAQHPLWLLSSIFLISLIESLAIVGILVPGVILLAVVAAAAGSIGLDLGQALLAGMLGAVVGDALSFYLGRHYKHTLRQIWPVSRYPEMIRLGEEFFVKHGGKSIFLGRFVGPLRAIIPLVAGMMNMNPRHFLAFNLASAIAWAPFYILPGYLTGQLIHLPLPENFYLIVALAAAVLCVIAFVFQYASRHLQVGSQLYDAIEVKKNSSLLFRRIWLFLTRHPCAEREFPLASIALLLTSLLGFVIWTSLTLFSPFITHMDQALLEFALALRNPVTDPFLISLTMIGDEAFLYCSFFILTGVMLLLKRPAAVVHLIAGGLATAAITHALKSVFALDRPELVLTPPGSFAYPSGHSSGIVVFYGLIASFIAQVMTPTSRWQIYLAFGVPMLLVALSRVLLGVHWLSDIIGGILLGLAICGLTRTFYSRWHEQGKAVSQQKPILLGGLLLWLSAAAAYQAWHFNDELHRYQVKPSTESADPKSSAAGIPDPSSPEDSASVESPTAAIPSDANPPADNRQNQSPASALPPSDARPAP